VRARARECVHRRDACNLTSRVQKTKQKSRHCSLPPFLTYSITHLNNSLVAFLCVCSPMQLNLLNRGEGGSLDLNLNFNSPKMNVNLKFVTKGERRLLSLRTYSTPLRRTASCSCRHGDLASCVISFVGFCCCVCVCVCVCVCGG
jgi:hypothetical protein